MMDARIDSGDLYLSAAGKTEYLTGVREAAQRVLLTATTAKGTFIYDRGFGTDFAALGDRERFREKLDLLLKEAAVGIAGTEVTVKDADAQRGTAVLLITHGGQTITTEVDLHGNI